MGRIIESKKFIDDNVNIHLNKLDSKYSRYLESQETTVTYLNVCRITSDVTEGFGSIDDIIGNNSPYKFKKIDNFLLYGIDKNDLSTNIEEYGITQELKGEAVILPNTIVPNVDDFFTIDYIGEQYLFKVTAFYKDHIKSSNYYRIEYELYKVINNLDDIFTGDVLENEYIMVNEDEKLEEFHIIKKIDYNTREYISKILDNMRLKYISKYYSKTLNSFIMNDEFRNILYDPYLTRFIKNSNIFVDRFRYDNIHVDVNVKHTDTYNFDNTYDNTIYGKFENMEFNKLNLLNFMKIIFSKANSPFITVSKPLYIIDYKEDIFMGLETVFDESFKKNVTNNNLFLEPCVENILIKYLNEVKLDDNDLKFISEYDIPERTLRDYLTTPLLMYIMNKYLIDIKLI